MSSNSIGKIFRFTTWGESHGKAIGCVIDGIPSMIPLKEKDIQIPVSETGAKDSTKLSEDYLASDNQRTVPMLELDDGTRIGEAMAICRYLETLHPELPLMGRNPLESARIDMWERRADMEGIGALSE